MADDNVTSIDTKPAKDPKQSAIAKIREGKAKEWNAKIEAQTKKAVDAATIADNESKTLALLLQEAEEDKAGFNEVVKDI